MEEQVFIEAHVHMDAWDSRTKKYVENGPVRQFWVMDTHYKEMQTPRHVKQDVILQAAKDMPEAIIPFARVNWNSGPEQVKEYFRKGFVGLKAIVPPKPYNTPEYLPLYEAAEKFRMPILFHTGIIAHSPDGWEDYKGDVRGYGPANMEPAFLATIADLFPDLVIIGGHPGFPYTEQTEHNLYYYPNLYHDISGYLPIEWFLKVLGKNTMRGDGRMVIEKLLFATDHCVGNESSEKNGAFRREGLYKFLSGYAHTYNWWRHLDCLWYKNAEKIMDKVLKDQAEIKI